MSNVRPRQAQAVDRLQCRETRVPIRIATVADCWQCRARKVACHGTKGQTCERCSKNSISCEWSALDGRSAEARRKQRRLDDRSAVQHPAPAAINTVCPDESSADGRSASLSELTTGASIAFLDPNGQSLTDSSFSEAVFAWQPFLVPDEQSDPISHTAGIACEGSAQNGDLPFVSGAVQAPGGEESRMDWWRSCGGTAVVSGQYRCDKTDVEACTASCSKSARSPLWRV